MQLSRRGAATVGGSGLYNFMQQRAPSAAPTHACLPLSPSLPPPLPVHQPLLPLFSPPLHTSLLLPLSAKPSPGWSILLLSLSFESELEARLPPFPIHVTVAANYFWPRHRRFYLPGGGEGGGGGGGGIGIGIEKTQYAWNRFVRPWFFVSARFLRSRPPAIPPFFQFSSLLFLPFFLSLFLSFRFRSCTCMNIHEGGRVLYWIQKPRRLPSFFSIRQELWERNSMERQRKLSLTDDRWMGELS